MRLFFDEIIFRKCIVYGLCDDRISLFGGMDTIWEIELGLQSDSLEQKWDISLDARMLFEIRVYTLEARYIGKSEVERCFHTREEHGYIF